jgi:hypothetical protein
VKPENLEEQIIRAHKCAIEFKDAIQKAQTAFAGELRVGSVADALKIQRNRIWREIINCPDADIDTVSGEPSWYLSINIDNITLEKIIFGKNGVKVFANKEASDE